MTENCGDENRRNAYDRRNIEIFANFKGRYFENEFDIQHCTISALQMDIGDSNDISTLEISWKMKEKIGFENGKNNRLCDFRRKNWVPGQP